MGPRIFTALPSRLIEASMNYPIPVPHPSFSRTLLRPFTNTPCPQARKKKEKAPKRSRYEDLYAERQSRARRLANLTRQETLKLERAAELGDPIRGIPTPFVESLDTGLPPTQGSPARKNIDPTSLATPDPAPAEHLAHSLTTASLASGLNRSAQMSLPLLGKAAHPNLSEEDVAARDRAVAASHAALHQNASEAVRRIASLHNASSKGRMHANTARIISTFGRHVTDTFVKPKAPSLAQLRPENEDKSKKPTPRAGPDTGSSEVQIALLTAKIRVLADELEGDAKGDKVNKRNLRLLLHRRQKLCKYMFGRERGSGRWERMVGLLGITDACWRGEIEVR